MSWWAERAGDVKRLCGRMWGALVGPRVTAAIALEEEQRQQRAARIDEWRTGVTEAVAEGRLESRQFLNDPWYLSLRRNLPERTRDAVEAPTQKWQGIATHVDSTRHRGRFEALLLDDIDRLAQEWDVV